MWARAEGGGGEVERSVSALTAEIWGSHIKGPLLADEGAVSNSTSYYYRRRVNVSLKNTQAVSS